MKIFVPDASVIVKWVIGEDSDDIAGDILHGWLNQEHDFLLPSLWVYEVGNVLGMKRPKDANTILDLLLEYRFRECSITRELIAATYDLMNEYRGATFYDAVYHAVALRENGTMVTADKAYYEKAKRKGCVMLI